jgi:hypothetical protein
VFLNNVQQVLSIRALPVRFLVPDRQSLIMPGNDMKNTKNAILRPKRGQFQYKYRIISNSWLGPTPHSSTQPTDLTKEGFSVLVVTEDGRSINASQHDMMHCASNI